MKNASSCNFYRNFRGKQLCHFSGFTDVVRIINSERKKGLCLLVFSLMKYTLSASSCSFLSAVSLPLFPPHLCFSLCDPARRPHRPSALLDVWELGRRRALRSGRDGWENVCESGTCVRMKGCVGGGKSPLSAFNGSRLLLLRAQVAGDREVVIITMSICKFAVGQEQSQRQINL